MTDREEGRSKKVHYCSSCGHSGHMAAEDHCGVCGEHPAPHKLGEEGFGAMMMHNATAQMCCYHFSRYVANCDAFPTFAHPERFPWAFRSASESPVDTSTYYG